MLQTAFIQHVFTPFTAFTFFPQSLYSSQVQGEASVGLLLTVSEHGSCES